MTVAVHVLQLKLTAAGSVKQAALLSIVQPAEASSECTHISAVTELRQAVIASPACPD